MADNYNCCLLAPLLPCLGLSDVGSHTVSPRLIRPCPLSVADPTNRDRYPVSRSRRRGTALGQRRCFKPEPGRSCTLVAHSIHIYKLVRSRQPRDTTYKGYNVFGKIIKVLVTSTYRVVAPVDQLLFSRPSCCLPTTVLSWAFHRHSHQY